MENFDSPDSSVIFTLSNKSLAYDWERDLEHLRHTQRLQASDSESNANQVLVNQRRGTPQTLPEKHFQDEELNRAYRAYLQQAAQSHNQNVHETLPEDDVGILMQEDWLQAQSALKTEISRQRAQKVKTLLWQPEHAESPAPEPTLPEFAIHVYALPDMPATRKVYILSEDELVNRLREKLTPHITHAVSGMMRQVLQKKVATLSYELQTLMNEEAAQVVQDVLEHHLESVLRSVKHQMRQG